MVEMFKMLARAGRMARIAKAARKAVRSSGDESLIAKRALVNLLADARGVPMKVGQFLASFEDESGEFQALARGIEARPLAEMAGVLEEQLGCPIEDVFSGLEGSASAASLGQVHKARLLDGTEVAVKIRYPDIMDAVEAEMRLAKLLPGVGPVRKWGFDFDAYKRTLKDNMDRELDYRSEMERQQTYAKLMNVPGLTVPRVFPQYCRVGVLVQSWEDGVHLDEVVRWSLDERIDVARILMGTLFQSVFVSGMVHGDPHLGNMLFQRGASGTPHVALLDYGCTIEIEEHVRMLFLRLVIGCIEGDETDPLACFVGMGFEYEKLKSIAPVLPAVCGVYFEPFVEDGPFILKYWGLGKRTDALLGELKWWFRSAGPPSLLLLMRAFQGLVMQLETLQVAVCWRDLFYKTVGPELLEKARAYPVPALPASAASKLDRPVDDFTGLAKFLKVLVTENGRQVVAVTMPGEQVSHIEDIIPKDVALKVAESGIDLRAIGRGACDNGLQPQPLFELDTGKRKYRVWLE